MKHILDRPVQKLHIQSLADRSLRKQVWEWEQPQGFSAQNVQF